MNASLKSTIESGLVALLAAACCIWFLISAAQEPEPQVPLIVLLSFGLAGSLAAHWAFMGIVVKRTGRPLLLWLPFVVILVPVGTVVLLALIASAEKDAALQASAQQPERF